MNNKRPVTGQNEIQRLLYVQVHNKIHKENFLNNKK